MLIVETSGQDSALVMVAVAVALWWLQLWKLFGKTTIDETLLAGALTAWLGEFTRRIHQPLALLGSCPCSTASGLCGS